MKMKHFKTIAWIVAFIGGFIVPNTILSIQGYEMNYWLKTFMHLVLFIVLWWATYLIGSTISIKIAAYQLKKEEAESTKEE